MRTLSGECLHFLLRRGDDLRTLCVDLVASTEEAVAKWDWTTRSSPIFPFGEFEYPDWPNEDDVYVFFVGPLDPASWDIDVPCYASLGTYNIVAVCTPGKGHLYDVRDFLAVNSQLTWECWQLRRGTIVERGHGGPALSTKASSVRRANVSHGLAPAEEENCTLFAAAIAKAARYMPPVAAELELFERAFRAKIEQSNGDGDNTKLSWLVNVNAALSRFTSQTFSGVSPIPATECHFWSHSLLGVGLATQALINIRRFSEIAVGSVDWIDQLEQLGTIEVPANWKPLYKRIAADASSWVDAEDLMQSALAAKSAAMAEQSRQAPARLPLIVCFSGRDGFRSTSFSLSAPLEVISAGNAYGWSPITLSHEISHVWINGVLSTIFPDPSDRAAMLHMSNIVQGKGIETVLDDLRLALYFAYTLLEREQHNIPVDGQLPDKPWLELVELHALQVNELLTHVLDYQFFYHQDEERYIKSIWSSWDVIPNIKERLQSYLIRSACAMLSERISHADAINVTLDRLEALLAELKSEMAHANYLEDALAILRTDRDLLRRKVRNRELLVRIAKVFLTNRPIAARLDREYQESGGVYASLQPLKFDFHQIWNPMRFLGYYCKDRRGERAKSLWLLTKVAFMQDAHATFT